MTVSTAGITHSLTIVPVPPCPSTSPQGQFGKRIDPQKDCAFSHFLLKRLVSVVRQLKWTPGSTTYYSVILGKFAAPRLRRVPATKQAFSRHLLNVEVT